MTSLNTSSPKEKSTLKRLVTTGKATKKMPNPSQCDNVKEFLLGESLRLRQSPTLWLITRHGSSAHTRTSVQYSRSAKTDKLLVPSGELRGQFPAKMLDQSEDGTKRPD